MLTVTNTAQQIRSKLVGAKALLCAVRRIGVNEGDLELARLAAGIDLLIDQALVSLATVEARNRTRGARS